MVALEELDEPARRKLLAMPDEEYRGLVAFCNRYPDIVLEFGVLEATDVTPEGEEEAKVFECAGDAEQVRHLCMRTLLCPLFCVLLWRLCHLT